MDKEIDILDNKIKNKIYLIRNNQVMLDEDLAKFYNVETKRLNEQVKRNLKRFPDNFMFRLTKLEYENLKSQFATSKIEHGGRRNLPYAFTEQGVAMLSGILNSDIAIQMSIQIINSFILMRKQFSELNLINNKLNNIEQKQIKFEIETGNKFKEIFDSLENKVEHSEGIFYDGQIFDAHKFINDLILKAKSKIILIDNYIDYKTLNLFVRVSKNLKITFYTKNITKSLKLDLNKFEKQYFKINIEFFDKSHDRFLIVDDDIYHIGASLKDIGKRWFAFSKMEKNSFDILKRLEK